MVGEDVGGPSKKPRIDLNEQVRKLQEKVKNDEKEKNDIRDVCNTAEFADFF